MLRHFLLIEVGFVDLVGIEGSEDLFALVCLFNDTSSYATHEMRYNTAWIHAQSQSLTWLVERVGLLRTLSQLLAFALAAIGRLLVLDQGLVFILLPTKLFVNSAITRRPTTSHNYSFNYKNS